MPLTQYGALTGRRLKRRYGPLMASRAMFLPEIYRRRTETEQTERELGLAERGLGLEEEALKEEKKQARLGNIISGAQLPISGYFAYKQLKELGALPKGLGLGLATTATTPGPIAPSVTAALAGKGMGLAGVGGVKTAATAGTAGAGTGVLGTLGTYALPIAVGLAGVSAAYGGIRKKSERRGAFRKLRTQYGNMFAGMSPEELQEVYEMGQREEGPLAEGSGAAQEAFLGWTQRLAPELHRQFASDIATRSMEMMKGRRAGYMLSSDIPSERRMGGQQRKSPFEEAMRR